MSDCKKNRKCTFEPLTASNVVILLRSSSKNVGDPRAISDWWSWSRCANTESSNKALKPVWIALSRLLSTSNLHQGHSAIMAPFSKHSFGGPLHYNQYKEVAQSTFKTDVNYRIQMPWIPFPNALWPTSTPLYISQSQRSLNPRIPPHERLNASVRRASDALEAARERPCKTTVLWKQATQKYTSKFWKHQSINSTSFKGYLSRRAQFP